MFLSEAEEQEVAAVPGRDLGCRHEDIVELRTPGRTGAGGVDAADDLKPKNPLFSIYSSHFWLVEEIGAVPPPKCRL